LPDDPYALLRSGPSAEEVEALCSEFGMEAEFAHTLLTTARPHDPLHAVLDELLGVVEAAGKFSRICDDEWCCGEVAFTDAHCGECPSCLFDVALDTLTAKLDSLRGGQEC
jgi:hypothetical protein